MIKGLAKGFCLVAAVVAPIGCGRSGRHEESEIVGLETPDQMQLRIHQFQMEEAAHTQAEALKEIADQARSRNVFRYTDSFMDPQTVAARAQADAMKKIADEISWRNLMHP